jgi:hypothetical protein
MAALLLSAAFHVHPAVAKPGGESTLAAAMITVGEPDGFAALNRPQLAVVDVFVGGARIGSVKVRYDGSRLTFLDPDALVAMLPELTKPEPVKELFSQTALEGHVERTCAIGQTTDCGTLAPDVAGLIFDRDRFRVDVFINPGLVAVRQAVSETYLDLPQNGLSLVNSIGGVAAGLSGGSRSYFLQNRAIIGSANRRLRADLAYASGVGLQADTLAVEIDLPGWRYSAGAFWAPGIELTGRRKIVGAGITTQTDTRLDKEQLQGTPLVASLTRRSRVDIVREGRVLASGIYDAGNQQLDTSTLPQGAYQVTLRVEDASGAVREESRFFARNPQIAALGRDLAFVYAGLLSDDRRGRLLSVGGAPFGQAGFAHRFTPKLALDATVIATDKAVVGEVGGYLITGPAQLRLAAIGSADGTYGAVASLSSQGNARLNYNFDLRHITVGDRAAFGELGPRPMERARLDGGDPLALHAAFGRYTQVNGVVSYSTRSAQILLTGSMRRDSRERTFYTVGPAAHWEVLRRGPFRVAVDGDFTVSQDGRSGFLGFSLQMFGGRSSVQSQLGIRSRDPGAEGSTSAVRNLAGSWQIDGVAGGDLSLGAGYQSDSGKELVNASANLRGRRVALSGDLSHPLGGDGTQYSLGFQTTLAANSAGLALNGRNTRDSAIIVAVRGARPTDRFEVLVDETVVGTATATGSLSIPLGSYREYRVRLRPVSVAPLRFDDKVRTVALYPGSAPRLTWTASPVVSVFGQVVLRDGTPMSGAQIGETQAISQSDDKGFFQIDVAPGATLPVIGSDGRSCAITVPTIPATHAFAKVGALTCSPQGPGTSIVVSPSIREASR